eukprot:jgi/Astpho2/2086/fgenesh1_pm.00038_%23_66_t
MVPQRLIRLAAPVPGLQAYVITTPLYYVNAAPHMGSAYSTISADTLARFQRLQGNQVTLITGTDEHGEKIALAAAAKGLDPQQHCNEIADLYKSLWKQLDIQYDSFVRTTSKQHEANVAKMLQRVWDKGDIYKDRYSGWYCVGCEEYKADDDLDEQHICPAHQKPCEHREEENYFFRLTAYQQQLLELIEGNPDFVRPSSRRNEVLGWVKTGIRDFSISRAAVAWGVPIPQDPKQTVYVWFDALTGYLSDFSAKGLQAHGWPATHIIGKDILRFHAVYWPGMLMSAGLPVPQQVFGHGFITKDGLKMGKSLGNTLDPVALSQAYGADAVRFYFMKAIDFGKDGDFQEQRFRDVVNASLANDIGNLLNRSLGLLKKNCGAAMPADASAIPQSNPLRALAEAQVGEVAAAYEQMAFSDAAAAIQKLSARGNLFMEEQAPWTAFKKGSEEQKGEAALVLLAVLETVRIVAVMLSPITPALAQRVYLQLGISEAEAGRLKEGQPTPKPTPVFQRLEGDFVTLPAATASAA